MALSLKELNMNKKGWNDRKCILTTKIQAVEFYFASKLIFSESHYSQGYLLFEAIDQGLWLIKGHI